LETKSQKEYHLVKFTFTQNNHLEKPTFTPEFDGPTNFPVIQKGLMTLFFTEKMWERALGY